MATTSPWVALLACLSACGPSADKVPANDNATPAAAQSAGGVAPVAPPVTVVDYYNRMVEIDAANHLYQFPYRISKTPLGWRCFDADSDLDRSYPCVVDVPNGFLSIEEEGTGSGMSITQIALFKKANGQIIMALNTQRREPVTFMTFTGTLPTFYAYRDGAFTTITKEVMPDTVTGDAFAAAPGTADSVFMFYDLPRHGTDITASVDLGFADYCKKPESERGAMNPDLLESVNRRCKIYNGLVRKSVALHFDKRTGRFELPK